MKKDLQEWNSGKIDIHENKERPFFHEREVWFTSLGLNIGFEQDGRGEKFLRPVVVVKKFNNSVCWCVPLTKSQKNGKYYFPFKLKEKISTAILSQIRLIDCKRLQYKIGDIDENGFKKLKTKITQLLR